MSRLQIRGSRDFKVFTCLEELNQQMGGMVFCVSADEVQVDDEGRLNFFSQGLDEKTMVSSFNSGTWRYCISDFEQEIID